MAAAATGHVLDYITGLGQLRLARVEASDLTPSVEVAYDGRAFLPQELVWCSCGY